MLSRYKYNTDSAVMVQNGKENFLLGAIAPICGDLQTIIQLYKK